jgi:hypothetical protein
VRVNSFNYKNLFNFKNENKNFPEHRNKTSSSKVFLTHLLFPQSLHCRKKSCYDAAVVW